MDDSDRRLQAQERYLAGRIVRWTYLAVPGLVGGSSIVLGDRRSVHPAQVS